nr:DUF2516 family protein [Nocardioides perillae]
MFVIEGYVRLLILLGLLAVKVFSFVSALMFPTEAYEAAGKLTKTAWCAILGIGVGFQVLFPGSPLGIFQVIFVVAAFVYLADVRPALASVTRR